MAGDTGRGCGWGGSAGGTASSASLPLHQHECLIRIDGDYIAAELLPADIRHRELHGRYIQLLGHDDGELRGAEVQEDEHPLIIVLALIGEAPKIVILRMRTVQAMDATALDALDRLRLKLKSRGVQMMITGAHSQPLHMMQRSGFLDELGEDFVLENIDLALAKAREILNEKKV